jgi:DNA-binding MarR family transcriptional regulator
MVGSPAAAPFAQRPGETRKLRLRAHESKRGDDDLDGIGALRSLSDDYVAVLVIAVANRLTRGASKYYRKTWNIGVVEWRIMICLGHKSGRAIGEIAEATDVDRGAISRSVELLEERGLVRTEAGGRRINLVKLTPKGKSVLQRLRAIGRRREERLMAGFSAGEEILLRALLSRLLAQVDFMNADDDETPAPRELVS